METGKGALSVLFSSFINETKRWHFLSGFLFVRMRANNDLVFFSLAHMILGGLIASVPAYLGTRHCIGCGLEVMEDGCASGRGKEAGGWI